MRPSTIEHWRLTSPQQSLIEAAASEYGGAVQPWGTQWEVMTETDALPIIVPPGQTLTQYMELWSGGGCQRRCDGITELLSGTPCKCSPDPAERECKPTTRLSVILPALPDIGVWRLETHSYYAAVELAGTADILASASRAGMMVPAQLRLDAREIKRPGQPTKLFKVSVLELPTITARQLMQAVKRALDIETPAPRRIGTGTFESVVPKSNPMVASWGEEPPLDDAGEPPMKEGTVMK